MRPLIPCGLCRRDFYLRIVNKIITHLRKVIGLIERYIILIVIFAIITYFRLGKNCYEYDTYDSVTYSDTTVRHCDYSDITSVGFFNEYINVAFMMIFSYMIIKNFKSGLKSNYTKND
jgi:hypothetical protein